MQIDLSSQKILVTGASRGIGAAIVRHLLDSGAKVIGQYAHTPEEKLLSHPSLQWIPCDFNEPGSVQSMITDILSQHEISGLVNNAGIAVCSEIDNNHQKWLEDWEKTMRINLTSSAILCRELIPHFIKNEGGRIINISSRAAFRGDTQDYLAYAASKGGMLSMARSIARAYGKDKIRVFNIAPGFTQTDMATDFEKKYGKEFIVRDQAIPDLTTPQHIAPTVTFLFSGLADHATGTTIDINAGSYIR
jgi:NAD(P)-dependent dehydrogenase (short-subunit alcohol dehydrogenase family)